MEKGLSPIGLLVFESLWYGQFGFRIRAVESASLKVGKSLTIGKNRKNRIKSGKKWDKIGKLEKIGKIGFEFNSDSTALFRIHKG